MTKEYSKVNDEIISKLNLTDTGFNVGRSFIYGLKIYSVPNKYKTYLFECEGNGEPILNDMFILRTEHIKNNKKVLTEQRITKEFLMFGSKGMLLNVVNGFMERELKKLN